MSKEDLKHTQEVHPGKAVSQIKHAKEFIFNILIALLFNFSLKSQ